MPEQLYPYEGGQLWLDPARSTMELAMSKTEWEHLKVNWLRTHLQPGMTFADVGAHCGYFTFLAAKWVGATGLVIAYEPDPDTLYWLARNLDANDYDHILLWDVAAGNCAEPVRLYQHENHGWTSAVRKSDHWVERPQRRLDETLLDHADVIKIDVEGVELNVLQGLEGLLPRLPHLALLMDLHPELGVQPQALDDWLHAHDFRLYDIRGGFAPLERIPPTLVELLAVNDSPLIIDEGDDCKNA